MKRLSACLGKMQSLFSSPDNETCTTPTSPKTGMAASPVKIELTSVERENFLALGLQQARCCVQRQNKDLRQFLVWFDPLNEGAANVVFHVRPWHARHESHDFIFVDINNSGNTAIAVPQQEVTSQVLRVSKGAPKCLRSEDIIHGFENDVQPLFQTRVEGDDLARGQPLESDLAEKHLMAHHGVVLFPNAMLDLVHQVDAIQKVEGHESRKSTRWGILLSNMSPNPGTSITLEIKPKWLLQSPTAPVGAIRCRTCALQYSRGKGTPEDYVCPLRLVNGGEHDLRPWATESVLKHASNGQGLSADPQSAQFRSVVSRLLQYMAKGDGRTLLEHIKNLQSQLDPQGILRRPSASDCTKFDHNIRLAMTLRDCSMFIVVPYTSSGTSLPPIISKLADLDFKSAGKVDDWAEKETKLVDGDWYTKGLAEHNVCWLTPARKGE
jgi:inositol-pentakisphosphate 2-kinase